MFFDQSCKTFGIAKNRTGDGGIGSANATSGLCCPPLIILIENFPSLNLDPRLSLVDQQTLILRIFYDLETSFVLTVERGRRDRDAEIDT